MGSIWVVIFAQLSRGGPLGYWGGVVEPHRWSLPFCDSSFGKVLQPIPPETVPTYRSVEQEVYDSPGPDGPRVPRRWFPALSLSEGLGPSWAGGRWRNGRTTLGGWIAFALCQTPLCFGEGGC